MATDITHQQLLDGTTDMLHRIADAMVTKQDLADALVDYPTKQDLKDELAHYATKEDLQSYPTKQDLKEDLAGGEARLGSKLNNHRRASAQHHLTTRVMIGELNRQLS